MSVPILVLKVGSFVGSSLALRFRRIALPDYAQALSACSHADGAALGISANLHGHSISLSP
jgi:hypothetical protein